MPNYRTINGMIFSDETEGAIDLDECPQCHPRQRRRCRCGDCSVCGNPKHSAIHGASFGEKPGSKPFGHKFVPIENVV